MFESAEALGALFRGEDNTYSEAGAMMLAEVLILLRSALAPEG